MAEDALGHFDVAIIGTGLTESLLAAALSKAGRTVVHLDEQSYYGGRDASLTLTELVDWARDRDAQLAFPATPGVHGLPAELVQLSRQYSLSLAPSLVPAVSDFVDALVRAGVSRYTGFRLLDAVALCAPGRPPKRVPASKEDVFKDRDLSLPDKRRLMKFLLFAAGDFEASDALRGHEDDAIGDFLAAHFGLQGDLLSAVLYAVSLSSTPTDRTLPVLLRLRGYLRAGGRYGNSPFLVGQYGGAGELAQGFCRVCAVFGGTYVLGRKIEDVALGGATDRADAVVRIVIGQDRLTADKLVTASPSPSYTPSHRGIAIIDTPIALDTPAGSAAATEGHETSEPSAKQAESALFVFPPSSFPSQAAALHCLMLGEGAFACPAGQHVLYLSTPAVATSTAEGSLRPALDALLAPSPSARVLFELFYTDSPAPVPACLGALAASRHVLPLHHPAPPNLAELPSSCLAEAHRLFKLLVPAPPSDDLFSPASQANDDDDDE